MAPAHPHATGVAVYPALFSVIDACKWAPRRLFNYIHLQETDIFPSDDQDDALSRSSVFLPLIFFYIDK